MKISTKAKLRFVLGFVLLYMLAGYAWWTYSLIQYGIREKTLHVKLFYSDSLHLSGNISHSLIAGRYKGKDTVPFYFKEKKYYADTNVLRKSIEQDYKNFQIHFNPNADLSRFFVLNMNDKTLKAEKDKFIGRKTGWLSEGITAGAIIFLIILGMYWFLDRMITLNQQQNNFLLAVTHELKTPVAAAKLAIQTVQKQSSPDKWNMLELANKNLNRLGSLMDNVLMATRLESQKWKAHKEAIEVQDLVNLTLAEIKSSIPESARIIKKLEPNLTITGEIDMLKMALSNMIFNAIKYSEKGNEEIVLRSLVYKNHVALQVEDLGIGISQSERKKIFQKFYRIGDEQTRMSSGSGLGLYLVYKILRQHNAIISVEDNQPKGSIFKIVFENKV